MLALPAQNGLATADRPLLTYCDDATGERTELSAAALGGWAARTAGLLREGCGLGTGSHAAVLLPPHWQTAAVLLGAWSIGAEVSFRPWATAGLAPVGVGADLPLDAVFVHRKRLDSWLEDVPDAPHRFVLPLGASDTEPPEGYRDFLTAASGYSASLPGYGSILPGAAASPDGTTYRQWGGLAREMAARMDLRPGDRLMVEVAKQEQPLIWLLAPLAAGASIVLCANLDPDAVEARAAAEGATKVL